MGLPETLAALASRVDAFRAGTRDAVLDSRVDADVNALLELIGEDLRGQAAPVLAWLFWYRFLVIGNQNRWDDCRRAREFAAHVPPHRLRNLPRPLQSVDDGPPSAMPGWARDYVPDAIDGDAERVARLARGSGDPLGLLARLADHLMDEYRGTGQVPLLDRALTVVRIAFTVTSRGAPGYALALHMLGEVLRVRAERTWALSDLDRAVLARREAAALWPPHHQARPDDLYQLGLVLRTRSQWTGAQSDVDEALTALREAAATMAPGLTRAKCLGAIADTLRIEFERTGAPETRAEAVRLGRDMLRELPEGHPDRVMCYLVLGHMFTLGGIANLPDAALDEAVAVAREGLTEVPAHDTGLAHLFTSTLVEALIARFERTGHAADVDAAVAAARATLARAPDRDTDRAAGLQLLREALVARLDHHHRDDDLAEALDVARRVVDLTPPGHPDRMRRLQQLGTVLLRHFGLRHDVTVLDEGVRLLMGSISDLGPAGLSDLFGQHTREPTYSYLDVLMFLLTTRHEWTGSPTDLDQVIQIRRAVLRAMPPGHLQRPRALAALGEAIRRRYEHQMVLPKEFDECLAVYREALDATQIAHPDRTEILAGLGEALFTRFESTRKPAELDEAVARLRTAVQDAPEDDPRRHEHVLNLARVVRSRFAITRAPADINESVGLTRTALTARPDDVRVPVLLACALADRYGLARSPEDLAEMIEVLLAAEQAHDPYHPVRAHLFAYLAEGLRLRYEHGADPADLVEAQRCLREASEAAAATIGQRLEALQMSAQSLASTCRPAVALPTYQAAMGLLPLLTWGKARPDQQRLLQQYATALARDAAAAAVDAGRPELAVGMLEQGRAVLWGQLLDIRTDLTGLARTAPDLAAQLDECRAVLDRAASSHPSAEAVHERLEAARRFDDLVSRVRALPPTTDLPTPSAFLRPPALSALLQAPSDGMVVIVNDSQWRCDALVVSTEGVQRIELPDLSLTDRAAMVAFNFYGAFWDFWDSPMDAADRDRLENQLTTMLEWLWDKVAAPILSAIGYTATPSGEWPRIWWCPTGTLAHLPLHAAGYHGTGNTVLDRVVSSYTSSLRALRLARGRPASDDPGRLLALAMPDTPDLASLPGATAEQRTLAELVPAGRRTMLTGAAANRAAVLRELGDHTWLHASCHGVQDLYDPSRSGLVPHDWRSAGLVTVTDLMRAGQRAGGREFAFLSACQSAARGINNLDEEISLAAALQYTGWRHVVGTLWPVWDSTAAAATRSIYRRLVDAGILDTRDAGLALHEAVRHLRDRAPARPSEWAPFVHIGP